MTMPATNYNGVIQVVLDTVNSVQLKMKKIPLSMTDEVREKQLNEEQPKANQHNIDPFTNEIVLTFWDWTVLILGTIFLAPIRALGVIFALSMAWVVAKIGLIGLSPSEITTTDSRRGWRRKLMDWYSAFGTLILWAAGFWINVKGQQASRAEAPILVGAPHSSFLEALIIYMCGSSPVSRHENKTAFLISACQLFYQAIFVDR